MRWRCLATRVHRALLARLDDNDPAAELALNEIQDPDDLRRALRYTVGLLAGEMRHDDWDHAGAVRWLEHTILQNLDHAEERQR